MDIFKKIAGVVLLIVAAFMSIGTLRALLNGITQSIREIHWSSGYGIGYAMGSIIGIAILVFIIFKIVKFALKLIKKKPIPEDGIDDIGTS
jgi:hypothetical protein